MQSYRINNVQTNIRGSYRLHHHLLQTCSTLCAAYGKARVLPGGARYFPRNNILSVSCTGHATVGNTHEVTIGRKSGDYDPSSSWGDYFASYIPPNDLESMHWMEQKIQDMKEEIKVMYKSAKNIAELINLVDTIQHLGLGYHFVNETDDALSYLQKVKLDNEDLQHVAVRFRLLRQHGFNVSSDVFCKFRDSDGNFDENLCKDARGLLSLYNAGYLAYPGEIILDDAISFASGHLRSMINDMDSPLKTQVLRALRTPLHRMVPRVEAMLYIGEYMKEKTRNDTLLNLAMVDYNFAQRIHLEELKDLSLWWKDLRMLDNLTCARDRLLENYFWVLGIFFEPQHSRARKMLTKYWTILTVVDDMYDVYGTYEECKILTDAFQRWDEKAVDDLPIILRDFYQKFITTINEFQDEVEPSEKYRVSYLIQEIQKLVVCYLQELEWYAKGQVPNFNERKKPAIDGNAGAIVVCIPLLGFDEVISEEAINWFRSLPDVVLASMEICRYNDEAASYEREMNAGQGPTSIACFMMEHNLGKDEAALQFEYFTDESWKKMNLAFLCPTNAPVELLNRIANYARVCSRENLLGFTYSNKLKELITLLLLKPFSL